jgi:hypothetical protein
METVMDNILNKYNWPTRTTVGDMDIKHIEKKIGFELPNDYKYFLSKYQRHETQIGKESFNLWDLDNLLSLNEGYEILLYLPNTFGRGDNGSGEFIGIEKTGIEDFRIILTPFIDLDRQDHIEIGVSFTDFILRMDNGEKWFKVH